VARRPGNSLLTWLLALLVGGLSLLGEGLHEFLGLHEGPVAPEGYSQGFSYASSFAYGNGRHIEATDQRERCHDASTCPICQYLAQGKVLGERFEAMSVAGSVPNHSPVITLFTPSTVLQSFQARAPPAV
jgi:hypothetical protein